MATTKIWPIKDSLKRVTEYAANPEKTEFDDLKASIGYAVNGEKTGFDDEKVYLTTGIRCSADTAFEEMTAVKEAFGKTSGNVAYHAYQSFKPGEVTPQLCHQIGVELAEKLWGDQYQVLVATHLDKEHLHNHIIEGKSDTGFPFFMEKLTNTSFYISFPVANGRVVVKGGSP